MEQYQNSVQDTKGNALPALIQVAFLGTNNLAPIFSDNGATPKGNPFPADDTGEYRFYAANGRYTITVSYQDKFDRVYDALMYDPVDSPLTAQALKDDLVNSADLAKGDALIAVKQPFTGSTPTTQHEFNSRMVSVFDFLTQAQIADVKSGAANLDLTAAIQTAINHCMKQYDPTETTHNGNSTVYQGKQKTLFFPVGTYKISATLNLSFRNHIEVVGEDEYNTMIRWAGADNGMMMDVRCSDYVTMSKFTLDGAHKAMTFIYHAGNGVNAPNSKGNVTGNHYSQIFFWNQIGYLTGPIVEFPDQYDPLTAQLCTASAFGAPTFFNSMDDSVIEACRFAPNSINNAFGIAISSSEINVNDCHFFGANGVLLGHGTDVALRGCVASLAAPHLNDGSQNHAFVKIWYGNCGQINNVALMNCYLESMDYLASGFSAKLIFLGQGPNVTPDNQPHIRQFLIEGGLYSCSANNWPIIDFESFNRSAIKLVNAGFQGINKGYIYAPDSSVEIIDNGLSTLTTGAPIWQPIVPGGYKTLSRHYTTPDFQVRGESLANVTVTIGATDDPSRLFFLSLDEALPYISSTKAQVAVFLQKNDTITLPVNLDSNIFLALGGFTLTVNAAIKNFGQLTISNTFVNAVRAGSIVGAANGLINFGTMTVKNCGIDKAITASGGRALFVNTEFLGASDVILMGADAAEVVIDQNTCTYTATGFVVNLGSKFGKAIVRSSFGATPSTGKWMRGTCVEFTSPSTGFANLYWATADGIGAGATWAKIGNLV